MTTFLLSAGIMLGAMFLSAYVLAAVIVRLSARFGADPTYPDPDIYHEEKDQ